MTFEYLKPFRTPEGNIVTTHALITIYGKQYIQSVENRLNFEANTLTPLTNDEYMTYLSEQDCTSCNIEVD